MLPANYEPKIQKFPLLDSTNVKARELAKQGATEGTVVVAEAQTAGRGRGDRKWHSPKGGLFASVLLFPTDEKRFTDLAILAGIAMAQSVREMMPKSAAVSVKWPNDCLVNGKKIGGVLCEVLGEELFYLTVVGMGLNLNLSESELAAFSQNPFPGTSFVIEGGGGKVDEERVLQILLRKLFSLYHLYQTEGFEPIQYLWEKNCLMIGKKIEFREGLPNEAGSKSPATTGTFLGIDELGAAVVATGQGERKKIVSGEISCFWP